MKNTKQNLTLTMLQETYPELSIEVLNRLRLRFHNLRASERSGLITICDEWLDFPVFCSDALDKGYGISSTIRVKDKTIDVGKDNVYIMNLYTANGEVEARLKNILKGIRTAVKSTRGVLKHTYLEKGITICDDWMTDPEIFLTWAKKQPLHENGELSRSDKSGNFNPENCSFTDCSRSKAVSIYKTDGTFYKDFNSSGEAAKHLGVSLTAISNCIRNQSNTAGGKIAVKAGDNLIPVVIKNPSSSKREFKRMFLNMDSSRAGMKDVRAFNNKLADMEITDYSIEKIVYDHLHAVVFVKDSNA